MKSAEPRQCWHAERSLTAIRFRDENAAHRQRPVTPRVHPLAKILQFRLKILLVGSNRLPVDSCACAPFETPERSLQCDDIDVMQQCGEPSLLVTLRCLVHPPEFQRQGEPTLRPDPSFLRRTPSRPAPSLPHLVSFGRFHGTMSQSDSRPRLSALLRLSLAARPRRPPRDGPGRVSWFPKTTFHA